MTVYVDLVFMNNLAVDGAVLLATAKARRLRPSRIRVLLAATVGALYASAMFWVHSPYVYSFGAKAFVSVAMVLLTFGYGDPLRFIRNLGVFYATSFATLGGVIGIGYLLRSSGSPWGDMSLSSGGGVILSFQMQTGLYIFAFLLALWLYYGAGESRRKKQQVETLLWDVEVRVDEEVWTIKALLDTGNRLYDPLTRMPVMIMDAAVWGERLPAGWSERLSKESADKLIAEMDGQSTEDYGWSHRLRLVPYRAVGGQSKLMLAIKPDAVILLREGKSPITLTRVLVGLDGSALSAEGTYRAIVHPDMASSAEPEATAPSQPA